MTTALPRYTGHVVGGLLDASPQPGSRARRDNGCTLRTHFRTSLYTGGEGRRERRRFTKNDNAIVPCLLVIGPSMPPPLRSRMNFQGNRLEGGARGLHAKQVKGARTPSNTLLLRLRCGQNKHGKIMGLRRPTCSRANN